MQCSASGYLCRPGCSFSASGVNALAGVIEDNGARQLPFRPGIPPGHPFLGRKCRWDCLAIDRRGAISSPDVALGQFLKVILEVWPARAAFSFKSRTASAGRSSVMAIVDPG